MGLEDFLIQRELNIKHLELEMCITANIPSKSMITSVRALWTEIEAE